MVLNFNAVARPSSVVRPSSVTLVHKLIVSDRCSDFVLYVLVLIF